MPGNVMVENVLGKLLAGIFKDRKLKWTSGCDKMTVEIKFAFNINITRGATDPGY